ncbi:unnamed protein product [Cladocopium goreaui]|uniref:FHA domain-containing protein n=1 Tax=Cladocopium goreaui TaxID=2562237 RepID=A0A9P1FZK9_9DINO|nr:unnamed protein product [Cladocopium goreaui]
MLPAAYMMNQWLSTRNLGLEWIRDLSSKNGIGIRKTIEQDAVPTVASFEQLEAKTSQVVEDGCCIVIPARSRRGDKQMTLRQRMITFRVKTVMVDAQVSELFAEARLGSYMPNGHIGHTVHVGPGHGSRHMGHGHMSPGHHGLHFGDHFSQAHDAAWEDEGMVCFEPTEKTNHSNWKWVGDGRGAYEKVDTFAPRSQGFGEEGQSGNDTVMSPCPEIEREDLATKYFYGSLSEEVSA